MTDQKPKHKPQKKRTLEEVLKSLQDLIRSDLVSAKPLQESWRESGRSGLGPRTAASEPDSFQDALFKLDQVIREKIIEPVERAQQSPPEPLYPDEEIEIEWGGAVEPDNAVGKEHAESESADIAAFDAAPISPDAEIEIQALEPDAAPPSQLAVAPPAGRTPSPKSNPKPAIQNRSTHGAPEPIVEEIEATSVESVEKPVDSPGADTAASIEAASKAAAEQSEAHTSSETIDEHQQTFDFTTAPASAVRPRREPELVSPLPEAPRETKQNPEVPTTGAAPSENVDSFTRKLEAPSEQVHTRSVEPKNPGDSAFTVEFTVKPKTPASGAAVAHDLSAQAAASAPSRKPSADNAKQPLEKTGVKKKSQPTEEPTDAAKTPSKPEIRDDEALKTTEEIPILEDVADLKRPSPTPLPSASQARDIAIRVIARINIERRKAGQAPLDIKTIERMQQYLADALSKRALNKPK